MIDAAQALFFVAAEEHGGAAVRAGVLHEPNVAGSRPEADEVFAQQAHAQRRAVRRRQLVRPYRGIQYSRIRSPISVPGPTRLSSSLSWLLSMLPASSKLHAG